MARGRKTGGRTKGTPNRSTAEIRQYAQRFDKQAIDGLVKIARSAGSDEKARVMAWKEVLDRAHGKPKEHIEHSGAISLVDLLAPPKESA